jgi:hypothetical protein
VREEESFGEGGQAKLKIRYKMGFLNLPTVVTPLNPLHISIMPSIGTMQSEQK